MRAATVVQVLQHLFYVLLHVLFYLWSLLNCTFGVSFSRFHCCGCHGHGCGRHDIGPQVWRPNHYTTEPLPSLKSLAVCQAGRYKLFVVCIAGTQNYSGQQVFDCVPAQGLIESGQLAAISVRTEFSRLMYTLLVIWWNELHPFSVDWTQIRIRQFSVDVNYTWRMRMPILIRTGRSYVLLMMFYYLYVSPWDLRASSANVVKLSHLIGNRVRFIIYTIWHCVKYANKTCMG